MVFIECIACQHGFHDEHQKVIQAAPEGMMGGARCPCKGECRDRPPGYEGWSDKALRSLES